MKLVQRFRAILRGKKKSSPHKIVKNSNISYSRKTIVVEYKDFIVLSSENNKIIIVFNKTTYD